MRITTDGILEIADEWEKRGAEAQNIGREALMKGGQVAAEFLNASAGATFRTGTLHMANKPQNLTLNSDSGTIEVFPTGKSQSGARQATVGFVQEHGRSYGKKRRAPTGWFSTGAQNAEGPVTEAMAAVWLAAGGK